MLQSIDVVLQCIKKMDVVMQTGTSLVKWSALKGSKTRVLSAEKIQAKPSWKKKYLKMFGK